MTRALCFDEDDEQGWNVLKEAALQLEREGCRPLLEPSPVDRGGHSWDLTQEACFRAGCALACAQHCASVGGGRRILAATWRTTGRQ